MPCTRVGQLAPSLHRDLFRHTPPPRHQSSLGCSWFGECHPHRKRHVLRPPGPEGSVSSSFWSPSRLCWSVEKLYQLTQQGIYQIVYTSPLYNIDRPSVIESEPAACRSRTATPRPFDSMCGDWPTFPRSRSRPDGPKRACCPIVISILTFDRIGYRVTTLWRHNCR